MTDTIHVGDDRHFAGTLTRVAVTHVAAVLGDSGVDAVLARAEETRPLDVLLDDTSWSTHAQLRRLLEAAADELGGPERLLDIIETANPTATTNPDVVDALFALGSPAVILSGIANGASGMWSVLESSNEQVSDTEFLLIHRFCEPYEPFEAFCNFYRAFVALAPKLFGYPITVLDEEECQLRGDARCVVRMAWHEDHDVHALIKAERRIDLLERRLANFQQTIEELVSTGDIEQVLEGVLACAARSVRAPGFLLVLEANRRGARTVYTSGVDEATAAAEVARIRAGDTVGMGTVVESARRRYGWLVALGEGCVPEQDAATLSAFGRLAATALDAATAVADARRDAATAHVLLELSSRLVSTSSAEEVARNVAVAMPSVIDCDRAIVALFRDDSFQVAATYGFGAELTAKLRDSSGAIDPGYGGRLQLITAESAPDKVAVLTGMGIVAMATAPIVVDGEVVGVLVAGVTGDAGRLVDDERLEERLRGLAGQVSAALRNTCLLEQVRHQAEHDSLTGLANRALLLDRAGTLLATGSDGLDIAALYVDLDGFKAVNDRLGHRAGDAVLRAVAERLTAAVRSSDIVARLGGDEFIVITDAGAGASEALAARIIDSLSQPLSLPDCPEPVRIGASIGIATAGGRSPEDLLAQADAALYAAKAAGKGRFVRSPVTY